MKICKFYSSLRATAKQSRAIRWIAASAPRPPRNDGFTLIELSIVIVVIGLLVGAVLVGNDLIRASKMHAGIAQLKEYDLAFTAFREKYGCPPGDSPLFAWSSLTGRVNCDKNIWDRTNRDVTTDGDIGNVYSQLYLSGIIKHKFITTHGNTAQPWQNFMPEFKLKQGLGLAIATSNGLSDVSGHANPHVFPANTTVFFIRNRGGDNTALGTFIFGSDNGTVHPLQAFDFDNKIDDGNALGGNVRATNGWDIVGTPRSNCANQTTGVYNVGSTLDENDGRHCAFAIRLTRQR